MNAGKLAASLLKNSSFILLLSIAIGLAFPGPARATEGLVTPALMLMMAFSLTEVDIGKCPGLAHLAEKLSAGPFLELRPSLRAHIAIIL